MVTTIQVRDETLELLKLKKKQLGASSYDETIKRMAGHDAESLAGFMQKHLSKKEAQIFLRDDREKHDRLDSY